MSRVFNNIATADIVAACQILRMSPGRLSLGDNIPISIVKQENNANFISIEKVQVIENDYRNKFIACKDMSKDF